MEKVFHIDGDAVRQLADILNDTNLTEIEYEDKGSRIRVARQLSSTTVAFNPTSISATIPVDVGPFAHGAPPISSPLNQEIVNGKIVPSPMVGTAYLAAESGGKAFIKVGDQVNEGQTLLIIEAMKVMNSIKAPKSGVILEICVHDAQPVEYGTSLVVIG